MFCILKQILEREPKIILNVSVLKNIRLEPIAHLHILIIKRRDLLCTELGMYTVTEFSIILSLLATLYIKQCRILS